MTVKEFIEQFSEKDMNKELAFVAGLTVFNANMTRLKNVRQVNKDFKDETGDEYYDVNEYTKNMIFVEL